MCQVFLLHREQDFCNFCCKPSKIKFCIEGMSVGEIYNTLLDSNEGDLSPHTSQTIYFSKTNENKMSDKEAPVGEVFELESGIKTDLEAVPRILFENVLNTSFDDVLVLEGPIPLTLKTSLRLTTIEGFQDPSWSLIQKPF